MFTHCIYVKGRDQFTADFKEFNGRPDFAWFRCECESQFPNHYWAIKRSEDLYSVDFRCPNCGARLAGDIRPLKLAFDIPDFGMKMSEEEEQAFRQYVDKIDDRWLCWLESKENVR